MPDKVVQVGDKVISFPSTMSDDDISRAISAQYGSLQGQGSQTREPSSMPGLPNFLHAVGLPGSMDEYRARSADVAEHPLKAAWQMGIKPVLQAGPAGAMVKEGYRAVSHPMDPMAGIHAASAMNPLAAPVVDAMTEQGLGSADANATGILGAAGMTASLAAPKIGPPVVRGSIKVLNKAASPSAIGAAGGGAVAGPIGAAAGAEVLPEMFPSWAARAQEGLIPTPQWAAKPTPQMNLFKQTQKLGNSPLSMPQGKPTPFAAQAETAPAATQPQAAPAPESPPVQSPANATAPSKGSMEGYYGKTAGKSHLKGNQRQLAGPTSSTAPNPSTPTPQAAHPQEIMDILNKPGMSDADLATVQNYFAQQRLANILRGGAAKQQPGISLGDMLQKAVGQ